MGTLLRSCVKVREVIKLPFGVVSGVGWRVRRPILDGVYIWQGEVKVLGVFSIGLNGILSVFFKTEMYSTQAW